MRLAKTGAWILTSVSGNTGFQGPFYNAASRLMQLCWKAS